MSLNNLFSFLDESKTSYHAVTATARILRENGYTELYESCDYNLKDGGKYFVNRANSSLIAFKYNASASGFMMCISHSDSPAFKVKLTPQKDGVYTRLDVEKYGDLIHYSWLDRPLSVAGRIVVKVDGGIREIPVNIDKDLLCIPSLAIHMNVGVNQGAKFDVANDLLPLYSVNADADLINTIADTAFIKKEDIVSWDLYLYVRQGAKLYGANEEFILSPRLDDLMCAYASLEAFLAAKDTKSTPVFVLYNNEEIGSGTKQGASSTFLRDTLYRISKDENEYLKSLANSFVVSADNAHAIHPAHPELADKNNGPRLNGGIVIKHSSQERYSTDSISDAIFRTICERAGVSVQRYYNRADMLGGTTLGPLSSTKVSVHTIDIGFAQLSMHSSVETAGANDYSDMVKVLTLYYESALDNKGDTIRIK